MSLKINGNLCIPYLNNLINNKIFKNIQWVIRMHPISTPEDIRLIRKNINIIKNQNPKLDVVIDNKSSLMSQIRQSSLHISLNSSVAMKCNLLNKNSIMTCPVYNKSDYFKDLRRNKLCFILEENYTEEIFTELVKHLISYNNKNDSNIYINSKHQLNKLLNKIL